MSKELTPEMLAKLLTNLLAEAEGAETDEAPFWAMEEADLPLWKATDTPF